MIDRSLHLAIAEMEKTTTGTWIAEYWNAKGRAIAWRNTETQQVVAVEDFDE